MNSISQAVQQQIFSKKCLIHNKNSTLLYIGNKRGSRRICFSCIQSQNIPPQQVVDIQDIINFNPLTSNPIFGPHQDENTSTMLAQIGTKDKKMRASIKSLFIKFFQDIEKEIEKIIKESVFRADSISKMIQETSPLQNEASKIQRIQKILIGQNSTEEQELQQCILEWSAQTVIPNDLERVSKMQSTFSTLKAEQIFQDVLKLISSMNLFQNDSIISSFQQHQQNAQKEISIQFCKEIQLSNQTFVPHAKYQESSQMKIEYDNNNNQINILHTDGGSQQCIFNQLLSKNTNYLIQLNYHNQRNFFVCGLISSDKIEFGQDKIYFSLENEGSTQVIRGKNLHSTNSTKRVHEYEIHINIEQKLFRICSINLENCHELKDKNYFIENKQYYFVVRVGYQQDKVEIKKIQEVHEFPIIKK